MPCHGMALPWACKSRGGGAVAGTDAEEGGEAPELQSGPWLDLVQPISQYGHDFPLCPKGV